MVTFTNKPDFNLIADTLSYLLSKQYGTDIVVTMTPKTEEQLKEEALGNAVLIRNNDRLR